MGLGFNPRGSGISAAKFFAARGAKVIVTDLKTRKELSSSLRLLKNWLASSPPKPWRRRISFVLGKHRESDFSAKGGSASGGKNTDLVIKNPGVRQDSKYLQIAKENNVPIETDVGIFLKNCPAQIIGVTGTRGKSTTAALIGEMLKTKNPPYSPFKKGGDGEGFNKGGREGIFVGGNIQMSPLNFLNQVKKDSKVVLELSSWMLEDLFPPINANIKQIKTNNLVGPHIAVLTNLMPDHLNTYKNFGDYVKAKALIFANQTKNDFAVLNYDDANVRKLAKEIKAKKVWFSVKSKIPGAYFKNGFIHWNCKWNWKSAKMDKKKRPLFFVHQKIVSLKEIKLEGWHNISNILAAVAVAKIEGAPNKAIKRVLKTFKGLPNRLEFVREVRGIKFYNDTTSTMPEATIAALRALSQIQKPPHSPPISPRAKQGEFPPEADPPLAEEGVKNRNIILIAGGSDKKLEYKELAKEIKKYCKAVVLFKGDASDKILKIMKSPCGGSPEGRQFPIIKNVLSMKDAVKNAVKLVKKGDHAKRGQRHAKRADIILLSPAAASFGLFQNEFDRGEQFVKIVEKL